jgi:hypothetical protein
MLDLDIEAKSKDKISKSSALVTVIGKTFFPPSAESMMKSPYQVWGRRHGGFGQRPPFVVPKG